MKLLIHIKHYFPEQHMRGMLGIAGSVSVYARKLAVLNTYNGVKLTPRKPVTPQGAKRGCLACWP